ncbi:MAG: DUF1640 domain-containing protein [Methylomonas sp.]
MIAVAMRKTMTAIAFDTLKFANKLKSAGVPDKQAEAEAEALSEVLEINLKELAIKQDIRLEVRDLEYRLDARFERVDGELKLIRWMLGVMLAGVMSLVLKAFF